MTKKESSFCEVSIPSQGDKVKSIAQTMHDMARHRTLADEVQTALQTYYRNAGNHQKASRIAGCGDYLRFRKYDDEEQTIKLHRANFCMHSMCPMCAWRKHSRNAVVLSEALSGIENLWLVTLTIPNITRPSKTAFMDLIKQSTEMLKKQWHITSYIANFEVTCGSGEYHPHIHAIVQQPHWTEKTIAENMGYWRGKWGKKTGNKFAYIDIERVWDTAGAIAEITKYICKPAVKNSGDIAKMIADLEPALHGIRQIRAAGEIKTRIAETKTSINLEKIKDKLTFVGVSHTDVIAEWMNGKYIAYTWESVLASSKTDKWLEKQEKLFKLQMLKTKNPKLYQILTRQG